MLLNAPRRGRCSVALLLNFVARQNQKKHLAGVSRWIRANGHPDVYTYIYSLHCTDVRIKSVSGICFGLDMCIWPSQSRVSMITNYCSDQMHQVTPVVPGLETETASLSRTWVLHYKNSNLTIYFCYTTTTTIHKTRTYTRLFLLFKKKKIINETWHNKTT